MSANVTALWKAPLRRAIPMAQVAGHDPLARSGSFPGSTQIRAVTDMALIQRYAELLIDGAEFPPITVVMQGPETYLLADGHHRIESRWIAHKHDPQRFPAVIEAVIHEGAMPEAIRLAIEGNRSHGKSLSEGDYESAFNRASEVGLIHPMDISGARDLLGCSQRTAERLTEPTREAFVEERNSLIRALSESGMTQEQIAEKVGLKRPRVSKILAECSSPPMAERNSAAEEEPPEPPVPPPAPKPGRDAVEWQRRIDEMRADAARRLRREDVAPTIPEGVYPLPDPPARPFVRPKADDDAPQRVIEVLEQLDSLPPADAVLEYEISDEEAAAIADRLGRNAEWLETFSKLWDRRQS